MSGEVAIRRPEERADQFVLSAAYFRRLTAQRSQLYNGSRSELRKPDLMYTIAEGLECTGE